jgi:hypothetical protein
VAGIVRSSRASSRGLKEERARRAVFSWRDFCEEKGHMGETPSLETIRGGAAPRAFFAAQRAGRRLTPEIVSRWQPGLNP